MQNVKSKM